MLVEWANLTCYGTSSETMLAALAHTATVIGEKELRPASPPPVIYAPWPPRTACGQ